MTGDPLPAMVIGVWVSSAHLDDVREAVAREAPDLLVIDCLMLGALAAAEVSHLSAVVLVRSAPGLLVPPGGPFERFLLLTPAMGRSPPRSRMGCHWSACRTKGPISRRSPPRSPRWRQIGKVLHLISPRSILMKAFGSGGESER